MKTVAALLKNNRSSRFARLAAAVPIPDPPKRRGNYGLARKVEVGMKFRHRAMKGVCQVKAVREFTVEYALLLTPTASLSGFVVPKKGFARLVVRRWLAR